MCYFTDCHLTSHTCLSYAMSENRTSDSQNRTQIVACAAGAVAGLSADLILFPLDTIKTRLQAGPGQFRASGGFTKLYAGIGPAAIFSIPSASLFFCVYETTRTILPDSHMTNSFAASIGETIACGIRVPVEVVKQRSQADPSRSSLSHLKQTIRSEGYRGLYRGYGTMIMREIPFSFIQFPVWEYLKQVAIDRKGGTSCDGIEAMACGAAAGAVAAFATNPLDVCKTRVMLAQKDSQMSAGSILFALRSIYNESGVKGLFAGSSARVLWIGIGGAVFLGGYEISAQFIESILKVR